MFVCVNGAVGERCQLRRPQSCLDIQQKQRVVALSSAGRAVGGGEQGTDLGVAEECDDCLVGTFGWDRQDPTDIVGVFGMPQGGEAEQGVDRGKACGASADAVASFVFQVIEERGHHRRVQVGEVQTAGRDPGSICGEDE